MTGFECGDDVLRPMFWNNLTADDVGCQKRSTATLSLLESGGWPLSS